MKPLSIFLGILVPGIVLATLLNLIVDYFDWSNHWVGPVIFGVVIAFGSDPFIRFFERVGKTEDKPNDEATPAL